jgi:hypothetical protein
MLPVSGPNSSAIAIVTGVHASQLQVKLRPYDASESAGVDNFLVQIMSDLFMSIPKFRKRTGYLYRCMVSSDSISDMDRIHYPEEIDNLNNEKRSPCRSAKQRG